MCLWGRSESEEETEREREKYWEICFKELVHVIVESMTSKICRAGRRETQRRADVPAQDQRQSGGKTVPPRPQSVCFLWRTLINWISLTHIIESNLLIQMLTSSKRYLYSQYPGWCLSKYQICMKLIITCPSIWMNEKLYRRPYVNWIKAQWLKLDEFLEFFIQTPPSPSTPPLSITKGLCRICKDLLRHVNI